MNLIIGTGTYTAIHITYKLQYKIFYTVFIQVKICFKLVKLVKGI